MKIFVTGGSGFVGSHLVDALLARGDEVSVIDNYATGRRDNLVAHKNLQITEGTIANSDLVYKLINNFQPDVIVHAAAAYKDPLNWEEDTYTNILGTVNVINAAKGVNCKRIIYFQTALCYGLNPKEQPIKLTHHMDSANSSYAISKTAGEQYIQISGIDYVSFRLANAYGPRNISGPLPTFFMRLSQNKPCFVMDTRRDFVYISDLINCVIKAVDGAGHGAYHISSGRDYAIKELFDATLRAMNITLGKEVEVRPRNPDDAPTILLDPAQTNTTFNWNVEVSLEQGIQKAINYYQKFGIEQTFTHLKQTEKN